MADKSGQWQLEAAGHIASHSGSRKRQEDQVFQERLGYIEIPYTNIYINQSSNQ